MYVKAVTDLYNWQKSLNVNNHPSPRGPLVRAFLDTHIKKGVKRQRVNHHDRGKHILIDGYDPQGLLDISKYFWNRNSVLGTRDRLCFLMSHVMLLRSENALSMQFPDLFSMELHGQGISKCTAIVATISFGKTNKDGKLEYGSALRHSDYEVCPIGAFALYFFSRFHHENYPFPDFSTRAAWRDTYVIPGKEQGKPLSYNEHAKIYKKVFQAAGINSSKVTHINRKSAINMVSSSNVSGDQLRQVGRWGTDRMAGCYLTGLTVDAIKCLAGFSLKKETTL